MQVRGKVTIVTGASGGIGLAAARKLAAAGAKLALAARSKEKLEALAKELGKAGAETLVMVTDMRDRAQVRRMVEETARHFGKLDILVNNAGQGMVGQLQQASVDDYQKLFELNVIGPVLAMQAAIPFMEKNGGGLIVNVSSMVSKMHLNGLSMYASTKAALNMISETAREELAEKSIRVSTVLPRMTSTDFMKNSIGGSELRRPPRAAGAAAIPVDPPDLVAEKILHAIETEAEEQYMDR